MDRTPLESATAATRSVLKIGGFEVTTVESDTEHSILGAVHRSAPNQPLSITINVTP